jgi:diacylglycerol kinase family enzyme
VLLNRGAQGVTAARLAWFRKRVRAEDLFVTETIEEGRAAVRAIVERGYEVLCPGGGDGTFMFVAGELVAMPAEARLPALMALRLGTGNAVHDVCGSSKPTPRGLARDLARAADPAEVASPLRLLTARTPEAPEPRLAQFVGAGLDADWQADYSHVVKRRVGNGPLLPLLRGIPGYVATASTRTIPRLIRTPTVDVALTAETGGARLDERGNATSGIADGETFYRGPATLVAASTVPSYSAGMRFFPHVDIIGDNFQLKVAVGTAASVLRNLGKVMRGEHVPGAVHDFAVHGVTIELARPTRYHVGGDVLTPTTRLTVGICPRTVPVLRARPR